MSRRNPGFGKAGKTIWILSTHYGTMEAFESQASAEQHARNRYGMGGWNLSQVPLNR